MRKVNKSFQSFDWPATMTQWDQKNFEVTFKVLHPYKRFMRKFYQNCLHVIGVPTSGPLRRFVFDHGLHHAAVL